LMRMASDLVIFASDWWRWRKVVFVLRESERKWESENEEDDVMRFILNSGHFCPKLVQKSNFGYFLINGSNWDIFITFRSRKWNFSWKKVTHKNTTLKFVIAQSCCACKSHFP
jgi:tRNA(Glu) U13 pseudouridine synthase TruD